MKVMEVMEANCVLKPTGKIKSCFDISLLACVSVWGVHICKCICACVRADPIYVYTCITYSAPSAKELQSCVQTRKNCYK